MSEKNRKKNKSSSNRNDDIHFIPEEDAIFDPDGSYTGVPNEVFYNNKNEKPIQDADDL